MLDVIIPVRFGIREEYLCRCLLNDGKRDGRTNDLLWCLREANEKAVLFSDRHQFVLNEVLEFWIVEQFPKLIHEYDHPSAIE